MWLKMGESSRAKIEKNEVPVDEPVNVSTNHLSFIKPPAPFSGSQSIKSVHPVKFISELEEYFLYANITEPGKLIVARQMLIGLAKMWESVFRSTTSTFEEFKTIFLHEYWSTERQQQCKLEFFSGRYKMYGGISDMADYFIKQVNYARMFRPPMDDETISVIMSHFSSEVEWCIRSNPQGNSISGVKDLLRRKDEIENRNNSRKYEKSYEVKINNNNVSHDRSNRVYTNHSHQQQQKPTGWQYENWQHNSKNEQFMVPQPHKNTAYRPYPHERKSQIQIRSLERESEPTHTNINNTNDVQSSTSKQELDQYHSEN